MMQMMNFFLQWTQTLKSVANFVWQMLLDLFLLGVEKSQIKMLSGNNLKPSVENWQILQKFELSARATGWHNRTDAAAFQKKPKDSIEASAVPPTAFRENELDRKTEHARK